MAVGVLKALAELGGVASLSQLAAALGESPAKVHRYLASLADGELVVQEAASSRYALGVGAIAVGLAAMRQSDVLTLAAAELTRLAESHDMSCFVSVPGNRGPTIIRWKEPLHTVAVNVKVGSVMPVLWSATGRAFAAFARTAGIEALMQDDWKHASASQKAELKSRDALDKLLATIRQQGCAPVKDVLLTGISAVAAPIFDADGGVPAVLTALGPTGSFDPDPAGNTAALVKAAARAVTLRLGGKTGP